MSLEFSGQIISVFFFFLRQGSSCRHVELGLAPSGSPGEEPQELRDLVARLRTDKEKRHLGGMFLQLAQVPGLLPLRWPTMVPPVDRLLWILLDKRCSWIGEGQACRGTRTCASVFAAVMASFTYSLYVKSHSKPCCAGWLFD